MVPSGGGVTLLIVEDGSFARILGEAFVFGDAGTTGSVAVKLLWPVTLRS